MFDDFLDLILNVAGDMAGMAVKLIIDPPDELRASPSPPPRSSSRSLPPMSYIPMEGDQATSPRSSSRSVQKEWERLHRELYGWEGVADCFKSNTELRKEIADFRARKPLLAEWRRYHRQLYGSSYANDYQTCTELRQDIADYKKAMPLWEQWKRLHREVYGCDGHLREGESIWRIQSDIDDFPARKPLMEEWNRLCKEFGILGYIDSSKTSIEIRKEIDIRKDAIALEKRWNADRNVTVCGTIVGHQQQKNELGLDCWVFLVTLDYGWNGILPLGSLNRSVQMNVRREYQRMTGHSIRSFQQTFPMYEGKRVRARIAKISQWRQTGGLPTFDLTDGVVEGFEGRGIPRVAPRGDASEAAVSAAAKEELHVGDVVEGHVQNIAKYGVFVDLAGGVTGLLHVKDTGIGYVRDLAAVFGKGDAVKVEVTGIDEKDGRRRVGFRLLDFPDKIPLATGAGKERPTLLLDGPGLWRSLGRWQGKGLAMLLGSCQKARRRAVLVADAGLERDMERMGDAVGLALFRNLLEKYPFSLFVCPDGADSVVSAMRRRACVQECCIVGNDSTLAAAVGVKAYSVTSDAGGLSIPELGVRCESTTSDGTASIRTASKILVDGLNCIRAKLGGKGLATVLMALKEAGRVPFTFFDASMQGTPDKDLQALIQRLTVSGEACVVPSGSDMDDYLLPMADSCGLDIVTNKRFHGKEGKYPWLTKRAEEGKRLHPFSVVGGMLLIPSLDICTSLDNGTVTKEVTGGST